METNRTAIIGMSLFCALVTRASTPVPYTSYDFTTTPTGVLFSLEFESRIDRAYNLHRSDNLASNDWDIVYDQVPGTGSSMVFHDHSPSSVQARFYRTSSTGEYYLQRRL